MKFILSILVFMIISGCSVHTIKTPVSSNEKSVAGKCTNKKIFIDYLGSRNGRDSGDVPIGHMEYYETIEMELSKRGYFSVMRLNGSVRAPLFKIEPMKISAPESMDYKIELNVDFITDETIVNWKTWLAGLSLSVIPTRFNRGLSTRVKIVGKNKKVLKRLEYKDSYSSWYSLFLMPLFLTDTENEVKSKIAQHQIAQVITELEKICSK